MRFLITTPPQQQQLLLLLCGMASVVDLATAQERACDDAGENCVGGDAADVLTYEDPTHGSTHAGESDNQYCRRLQL
jgi:hypothetical protein